jgi:alpha-tubulin suppressor-like RCC1 family protein
MRRRSLALCASALAVGMATACTALLGVDGPYRAETDASTSEGGPVSGDGGDAGHGGDAGPGAADASDAFPAMPGTVASVTAGRFHTCARFSSGVAMCWGRADDFGELGNGTFVSNSVAAPAMGAGLTQLMAGAHDTCGLLANGAVCAGKGGDGELGDGVGDADSPVPVPVTAFPATPSAIASGEAFTCAVVGGDVYCVGDGASGTLGNGGSTGVSLAAVQVDLQGKQATAIAAFNIHACALLGDGTVSCWGDDSYGQLGNGEVTPDAGSATPVPVAGLPGAASAVCVGDDFSCAIVGDDADSTVWCWGDNSTGELGNDDPSVTVSATPVQVHGDGVTGAASLACGAGHACIGNDSSGGISCWGKGGSGQLGNDDTSNSFRAVAVSNVGSFPLSLAAGGFHTCAILASPQVLCWGADDFGQLGNGNTTQEQVPTPVMGIP